MIQFISQEVDLICVQIIDELVHQRIAFRSDNTRHTLRGRKVEIPCSLYDRFASWQLPESL